TDNGAHTFTNGVKLVTAGSQTVTATDTVSATITGKETVTVNPGKATKFAVAGPTSVFSGVAFNLTLTALDAYGNVDTNYRGKVKFDSSPNAETLPAPYTFTASDNGVHTFTGLVLKKKGNQTPTLYTITVSDADSSSIQGTITISVL